MLIIAELHFSNEAGKNVEHIAKHRVTPEEIEELCAGDFLARETYGGRIKLIGQTGTGRLLAVILGPMHSRQDGYYPITARDADKQERTMFRSSPNTTKE